MEITLTSCSWGEGARQFAIEKDSAWGRSAEVKGLAIEYAQMEGD